MNHRLIATAALGLAACLFLGTPAEAQAASDWTWVRGKGWSEGAGQPKGSAREQLNHAYALEKKGEFYDAARQYFLLMRRHMIWEEYLMETFTLPRGPSQN